MVYELWREIAEESEVDNVGRKPEIGHVFLIDRGVPGGEGRGEGVSCLETFLDSSGSSCLAAFHKFGVGWGIFWK